MGTFSQEPYFYRYSSNTRGLHFDSVLEYRVWVQEYQGPPKPKIWVMPFPTSDEAIRWAADREEMNSVLCRAELKVVALVQQSWYYEACELKNLKSGEQGYKMPDIVGDSGVYRVVEKMRQVEILIEFVRSSFKSIPALIHFIYPYYYPSSYIGSLC